MFLPAFVIIVVNSADEMWRILSFDSIALTVHSRRDRPFRAVSDAPRMVNAGELRLRIDHIGDRVTLN